MATGGDSLGLGGQIDHESGPQVRSDIVASSRRLDFKYYSNKDHHANTISHAASSSSGLPRAQGPLIPQPAFSSPKMKQLRGKLRYSNHPTNSTEWQATPMLQNGFSQESQAPTASQYPSSRGGPSMLTLSKHFLRRTNASLQYPLPKGLDSPPTRLKSIQEELEATKMLDQTMTH